MKARVSSNRSRCQRRTSIEMQDSQVVRPPKDRPASPSKSASQWLRDHRPGWHPTANPLSSETGRVKIATGRYVIVDDDYGFDIAP
jgi:hypothetical protein